MCASRMGLHWCSSCKARMTHVTVYCNALLRVAWLKYIPIFMNIYIGTAHLGQNCKTAVQLSLQASLISFWCSSPQQGQFLAQGPLDQASQFTWSSCGRYEDEGVPSTLIHMQAGCTYWVFVNTHTDIHRLGSASLCDQETQNRPWRASMMPKVNSRKEGIILRTRRKRTSQTILENGSASPMGQGQDCHNSSSENGFRDVSWRVCVNQRLLTQIGLQTTLITRSKGHRY